MVRKTWSATVIAAITLGGCGGGANGLSTEVNSVSSTLEGAAATVDVSAAVSFRAAQDAIIERFEVDAGQPGQGPLGWTFFNGVEFFGATGDFGLSYTDQGKPYGALRYDFNCASQSVRSASGLACGRYVEAKYLGMKPVVFSGAPENKLYLRYNQRSPLQGVSVRIKDGSGQTLQYKINRSSLETIAGAPYTEALVHLNHPGSFWGGSGNGLINQAINSISILSTQEEVVGPASSLDIHEITLRPTADQYLSLTGGEQTLSKGVLSSLTGRVSVTALYHKLSESNVTLVAEAAFDAVRLDIFWDQVEKGGAFDFSAFEAVLNRLQAKGLSAILVLSYGHPEYGGASPRTAEQRMAFVRYAKEVAAFAKNRNVTMMEVWNEPDSSKFWGGTLQEYSQLLKDTAVAVRAVDPSLRIVNGGISWMNLPYINKLADTGAFTVVDALAVHPYRKGLAPETLASDLAAARELLSKRGLNIPVINTEWGYSSYGSTDASIYGLGADGRARTWQAQMTVRALLSQLALNMPAINVFQLVDNRLDDQDPEENFGLLDASGKPKLSYIGLKHVLTTLRPLTYQGMVANVPAGSHAMRWKTKEGRDVFAVWVENPQDSLVLNLPRGATVERWDGTSIKTMLHSAGQYLRVTAADGPLFVRR